MELLDRFKRPERNDLIEGPLLDRFNVSYVLSYAQPSLPVSVPAAGLPAGQGDHLSDTRPSRALPASD